MIAANSPNINAQVPGSGTTATVRMTGAGADIWGTADGFQFMYQQISGDCDIRARVISMTNPNAWAKAGVMVRETLAANSTYAMTFLSLQRCCLSATSYDWRFSYLRRCHLRPRSPLLGSAHSQR